MFVCNFNYDMQVVLNAVEKVKNIEKAVAIEDNNTLVIALTTKPIFTLSEKQSLLYNVKNIAKPLYDGKVIVTTNSEIYCDIVDFNQGNKKITPNKIIKKAERYNENV